MELISIRLLKSLHAYFQVFLLANIQFLQGQQQLGREFPAFHPAKFNILPYSQLGYGYGMPYGNIGLLGLGLQGMNGLYSTGDLYGGFNGLGATGVGYHDNHSFGKQGFGKGAGGAGYGMQNGFGGLYGAKGGFGDQFIGGNSNTFAKEKVFSQNKNFGSGTKGGFGTGYGAQGSLHGQGAFGGYGGMGTTGQAGFGNQGLYTAAGLGAGGYGQLSHNDGNLHGKGLAATGWSDVLEKGLFIFSSSLCDKTRVIGLYIWNIYIFGIKHNTVHVWFIHQVSRQKWKAKKKAGGGIALELLSIFTNLTYNLRLCTSNTLNNTVLHFLISSFTTCFLLFYIITI